ncbi:MAG: CocE/NonD family hydrolase [Ascidiaceihabitans sp.]|jgi:putative CocE/NonD family hydrolase|tara:strand:+ start:767 stop:2761 length:1995 start_codon:yes stop_codon:yes gene_type:complete
MTQNSLREICEDADYGITLSDSTRLSTRLWKPIDALGDPVPVILEFLPYRKRDGTNARDALTHPYFAQRGYACARVDMRGNGDSHGLMADEYTQQELDDAVEVIRHLAAQDWCNGSIGMMGISWGGFNSLQVAAMTPPELKAVITLCSTVDRFADDIHYKGGCLLNENLGWGATMWSYSGRAPDPALRSDWREMWLDRLENEPFLPAKWLRHQTRDEYWKHGSVCEDFSTITAKVLAIGGWGDAYKNTVSNIVENIDGSKGIVGPWVHKYPHFATPEPRIGFLQEALRWWDKWLKGIETGVENDPDLRLYQMDGVRPQTWYTERAGRWVAQTPERDHHHPAEIRKYFLGDDGLTDEPATIDANVISPQDCGADSGEYCAIWLGPEMPGDQRRDDALSAIWDGNTLDSDLVITGAPEITLCVSSDKPVAQLAARLNHIHPDGSSTRITYGILNLCHRDGHGKSKPLPINQSVNVTLNLDQCAYTVPAGHRVRVSISNAYWPLLWPSPEATRLQIHSGTINLPLLNEVAGSTVTFPPPEAADPWETTTIREDTNSRRQETDLNTGIVHLHIVDDFGKVRDADHGLINGSIAREHWQIHPNDPLSAKGSCHWTDELERKNIRLRTEARCEMWSDKDTFYLSAKIEAFENDQLIYQRDLNDEISRNGI